MPVEMLNLDDLQVRDIEVVDDAATLEQLSHTAGIQLGRTTGPGRTCCSSCGMPTCCECMPPCLCVKPGNPPGA